MTDALHISSNPKITPTRTRYAPSPTGYPHIGNLRTAIFSYLIARQTGGQFILRIEDTDRKRYVEGSLTAIKDSLEWLGLDYDEGPDIIAAMLLLGRDETIQRLELAKLRLV